MSRIETMNRKGIKDHCWGLADWKPTNSPDANRLLNGFVNRSLLELAKDVPFLFEEALIQTPVYKDIVPVVTSDTFETTLDPWVLRMTVPVDPANTTTPWEEDVDWDGRPVQLKGPDDVQWRLRTIREAWTATNAQGVVYRYISLTQPYPRTAQVTDIDWKVFAHVLRLPSNVVKVKSAHMLRDGVSYPLGFQLQGSAEAGARIRPGQQLPAGQPRRLFGRPPRHLDAPAYTPTVSINAQAVWLNERPPGKFEYCYTYVWGRGEPWDSTGGPTTNALQTLDPLRQVPWLESPPSGVTDEAEPTGGVGTISISLPNHDRMLGFNDPATLRYGRTGLRKRIYVRRLTDPSGLVEIQENFYLLDEVEGDVTTYGDNGSKLPDLGAPLRANHLFQHLEMYPPPDQRYDLMLRVTLAPPRLENESASPHLPEVAMEGLLARIMMYLYQSMGNAAMKGNATMDYDLALQNIRKNYGMGIPASVPRNRRPAQAGGRRRLRRSLYPEDPSS